MVPDMFRGVPQIGCAVLVACAALLLGIGIVVGIFLR